MKNLHHKIRAQHGITTNSGCNKNQNSLVYSMYHHRGTIEFNKITVIKQK